MNPTERYRLRRIQNSFENFSESDKTSLTSLITTNENIKSPLPSLNKNMLVNSDTNTDSEDSIDSDDSSFYEDTSETSASSDEDSCGSDSDTSSSDEADEENNLKSNKNQLYSKRNELIKKKEVHHADNDFSDSTDSDSSESESDEHDDSIGNDSGKSKVKVNVPPPPPLPDFILPRETKIIANKRTMGSVRPNLEKGVENTLDKVMEELLAGRCMLKPVSSRQLRKVQASPNSQDLQGILAAALKKRLKSINNNENDDSAYDDSQGSQSELDDCEQTKESVHITSNTNI